MNYYVVVVAAAVALAAAATLLAGSPAVPDYSSVLLFLALAVAATIFGSMVGLGGGIVLVPVLVFLGLPPQVASSGSLVATLCNAITSTMVYAQQKRIEYRHGLKLGLLAAPGSVLGAVISADADLDVYRILLAVTLISAAVYVCIRSRLRSRPPPPAQVIVALSVVSSFFAGVVSSFFGIGGGVVFVPLLVILFGMSILRAAPTSMFALLLTSTVGVATHGTLGNSDAVLPLALAAGGLIGGMLGARISLIVGGRYLGIMAVAAMLSAAIKLAWDAGSLGLSTGG